MVQTRARDYNQPIYRVEDLEEDIRNLSINFEEEDLVAEVEVEEEVYQHFFIVNPLRG